MSNEQCECVNWARVHRFLLTKHHEKCEKYNLEDECYEVIKDLLRGIEFWSSDEDGVHPDCWEAYKKAKIFCGQFDIIAKG